MRGREGLIERIRQLRAAPQAAGKPAAAGEHESEGQHLRALEARVEHLEKLVEGLQDSVHRESLRQSKRIAELEGRVQPAALGKALSDDARARGL